MFGSVVAEIFLGITTSKMKELNMSNASPKNKDSGKVLPFYEWPLSSFINVAHDINLIGLDVKKDTATRCEISEIIKVTVKTFQYCLLLYHNS